MPVPPSPADRARAAVRARLVDAARDGTDALVERVAQLEQRLAELEQREASRHEEVLAALAGWERRTRRDVMTALERQAADSSAAYLREAVPHIERFTHPHDTLRHALASVAVDGMALEFGVATGTTLRIIAEEHARGSVHGFDVFTGLPEDWRLGFPAGEFAQERLPEVAGAELVVGLFADTLPAFLAEHPGPVAFAHLDADLYSSTATVLELVGPRLVPGSVLLFDEYWNYPGWQDHEHRAWHEHVARTGLGWRWLGMTMDDEQVSVLVTSG
ncbi:MAG TPA: class I SAM-dependent methyltransferase [Mycobacteriales bacterium]|nr:class I SAM-dependent methyltransferase [Mycobacteriales bacterium]